MSEQDTSGGATPPNVQPATGTLPASTGATPTKPSIEELQARIAELEKHKSELERHSTNKTEEAARHGKARTDVEKELAAYKEKERLDAEATLSEIEKSKKAVETEKAARAAIEQLNQQYKNQLIAAQVKLAAQSKGIIDPDLAAMAIQDKLELGDDGMPTNVDKALDDLIKNKPYLAPKPAETTQEQTTPAQTANNQRPPATPAMNPGRSAISTPDHLQPNQRVTMAQAYQMNKTKR